MHIKHNDTAQNILLSTEICSFFTACSDHKNISTTDRSFLDDVVEETTPAI